MGGKNRVNLFASADSTLVAWPSRTESLLSPCALLNQFLIKPHETGNGNGRAGLITRFSKKSRLRGPLQDTENRTIRRLPDQLF